MNKKTHRNIFLLGSVIIVVALPLSPFLLTVGLVILAANWVAELGFKEKLQLLRQRKGIVFFSILFFVHLAWLFNTSNFSYALHDIKIKFPLFFLPLIYGTTQALSRHEFKIIIHFFLATVLIATLISVFVFLGFTSIEPVDHRKLSVFISHIRFSLLMVLSVYILISLLICNKHYQLVPWVYYVLTLAWFLFFIILLGAFTGAFILFFVSPFALFFWFGTKQGKNYKPIGTLILVLLIVGVFGYIGFSVYKYSSRVKIDESKLEKYTVNGNRYAHFPSISDYENQNRVWFYICDKELKTEWEKRSNIKFEGKDMRGQFIRSTMLRYLTSLGYRKDSVGVSKLTRHDIEMIENGYTNYIYKNRLSVYPRLYQLFWEIEMYLKHGNPSGHSFTQRIEYMKNAIRAIKRNFWFGSGTGDVNDEIIYQYNIDKSKLAKQWQFRAHNQIITFFLAFGLTGFLIIILSVYGFLKSEKPNIDFISFTFLLIVLFSMLNEDTFETQAGVCFYAFFASLFIFGRKLSSETQ